MNFLQAVENQLKNFAAIRNGNKGVFLDKMKQILLHPKIDMYAIVALEEGKEEHKTIVFEKDTSNLTTLPDKVKVKRLVDVKNGETFFFLEKTKTKRGFLYTLHNKIIYKAEGDLNTETSGYYWYIGLERTGDKNNLSLVLNGTIHEVKVKYVGNSISSNTVYGRTIGIAPREADEYEKVLVVEEEIINDLILGVKGRKLIEKYVYEQLNSCE